MLDNKILTIASAVRKWAERRAVDANYNPDNLCGWCAISSGELFCRLREAGFNAEIHINHSHTFLTVDDHIVDVTATQFIEYEDKPVLIVHEREVEGKWFYIRTKSFTCVKELRKFQIKEKWPGKQIVYLTGSYQPATITA